VLACAWIKLDLGEVELGSLVVNSKIPSSCEECLASIDDGLLTLPVRKFNQACTGYHLLPFGEGNI
jgi:hypothetical protein